MNDKVQDAALLDAVMGYCAVNNVDPESLSNLPFKEVAARLARTCQTDPNYVWASREVRRYYPICHTECHIARVQKLVGCKGIWPVGSGPHMNEQAADNVIEFPANPTRH